jgi:hypothetical protein
VDFSAMFLIMVLLCTFLIGVTFHSWFSVSLDELPRPEQIMFGFDYDTGCASMSWCYAEPRVLTKLCVTPVPFTFPRPLEAELVDESLKVRQQPYGIHRF